MTDFKPPGPGFWRKDDSHLPDPASRYALTFYMDRLARYLVPAMAFYGSPVERGDLAIVAGRMYMRIKPVGAPEPKDGKPPGKPPKFLFKLIFRFHPEIRRRTRRAAEVLDKKLWREVAADFRKDVVPRARAANLRLQAIDPRALDDGELLAHIAEVEQLFDEGLRVHNHNGPAIRVPVGDWLHHAVLWTKESPVICLKVLRGSSPASAVTGEVLDRIAAAVDRNPAARAALRGNGVPAERLARLRAISREVGDAIDAYLEEHGHRMATGYDFVNLTLNEMPGIILSTIAARLDARTSPDDGEQTRLDAAQLRDRVPQEHRAEYDGLLEEARLMFGLRDEDVGVLWSWPQGLLRRALLAAGERLAAAGTIADRDLVFEATEQEVRDVLTGAPAAPSGDELAARRQERLRLRGEEPPMELGPRSAPPPDDWLPAPWARMMKAIFSFHHLIDLDGVERGKSGGAVLGGHGISTGRYEGPARVIRGPQDFHRIAAGDVLVARVTAAGYNAILPMLGAVVTDRGGPLCHTAVVAREFGIPGVVGTGDATERIPDGGRVRVDGDAGTVEILG